MTDKYSSALWVILVRRCSSASSYPCSRPDSTRSPKWFNWILCFDNSWFNEDHTGPFPMLNHILLVHCSTRWNSCEQWRHIWFTQLSHFSFASAGINVKLTSWSLCCVFDVTKSSAFSSSSCVNSCLRHTDLQHQHSAGWNAFVPRFSVNNQQMFILYRDIW
jgi:hypothetical protein